MKKRYKVLILGIGQSNFLNQLYGGLKTVDSSFQFIIDGYREISSEPQIGKRNIYDFFFDFKAIKIPKFILLKLYLELIISRLLWQIIIFEVSQNASWTSIKNQIKNLVEAKYRARLIDSFNFNLIHFHFCIPENLQEIYFLKKDYNLICSFWGSDLLRVTGIRNVFYVRKALEKASIITIQTPELAEILLSKYGRKFKSKIKIIRFTLNDEIFRYIDENRNAIEQRNSFKKKNSIPFNKIVIAVGHNLNPANNHIKILKELNNLSTECKNRIVIIIHAGYGGSKDYLNKVREFIMELKNLQVIILDTYYDANSSALFRLATDILIHLPETDALSAAMTETLYAGNQVVTGSWLPYGVLIRNDIHYTILDYFGEVKEKVEECILNIENNQGKNFENPRIIKEMFLPEKSNFLWLQLFNTFRN